MLIDVQLFRAMRQNYINWCFDIYIGRREVLGISGRCKYPFECSNNLYVYFVDNAPNNLICNYP